MKKVFLILLVLFFFSAPFDSNAAQQTLDLKQGFNFICFTLKPDLSAAQLKQQNTSIGEIYSYNAAAGSFLSVSEGSLTSLDTAKGYIINANSALSLTVSGTTASTIGNITLKSGFNLVGISKTITSIKFSDLIAGNSSIKGMYKWSNTAGAFIQALRNSAGKADLLDGVDPALSQGNSYFFYVDSETALNYDNGTLSFGGAATAADEEAIKNLYAQHVSAIKNKDITAIMTCYSENFSHLDGENGVIKTKNDIQSSFSKYVYTSAEGTVWSVNAINFSSATSAKTSVTCKTVLDGNIVENETYTDDKQNYLVKENGKWLIAGNQKKWEISGFTAHSPGKYFVELYITDAANKVTSATISGPGVTSANATLIKSFYAWMPTRWAPNPMPEFGATKPSTSSIYTFSIISDGISYNQTLNLGFDFIDEIPSIISPASASTASPTPTFTWNPVSYSDAVYHVELSDMNYNRIWDGADSAATSSTYTGVLTPGSYRWNIATKRSNSNNISLTDSFIFTVQ